MIVTRSSRLFPTPTAGYAMLVCLVSGCATLGSLPTRQTQGCAGKIQIQIPHTPPMLLRFVYRTATPGSYTLTLLHPLGARLATLEGTPTHTTLQTAEGERYTGTSSRDVLQQALGWSFPFQSIPVWAHGRPDPALPAPTVQRGHQGPQIRFTQAGWQVLLPAPTHATSRPPDSPIRCTYPARSITATVWITQWTPE